MKSSASKRLKIVKSFEWNRLVNPIYCHSMITPWRFSPYYTHFLYHEGSGSHRYEKNIKTYLNGIKCESTEYVHDAQDP